MKKAAFLRLRGYMISDFIQLQLLKTRVSAAGIVETNVPQGHGRRTMTVNEQISLIGRGSLPIFKQAPGWKELRSVHRAVKINSGTILVKTYAAVNNSG